MSNSSEVPKTDANGASDFEDFMKSTLSGLNVGEEVVDVFLLM